MRAMPAAPDYGEASVLPSPSFVGGFYGRNGSTQIDVVGPLTAGLTRFISFAKSEPGCHAARRHKPMDLTKAMQVYCEWKSFAENSI